MNFRSIFSGLFLAATAVFAMPPSLHAGEPISPDDLPVLLTIDLSDLSHVMFTGTGENSWASDSDHMLSDGITLSGFFSTPPAFLGASLEGQTLYPNATGTNFYTVSRLSGSPGVDLTLANYSSATQIFTLGSPALTGSASINFAFFGSDLLALLPSAGQRGYLYAGNTQDSTPVLIGTWAVVPESSTTTFLFISAALMLLLSRVKGVTHKECGG